MDTLKQLQEKGEAEFKERFNILGNITSVPIMLSKNASEEILDFLHQQTTLAFEAGKAEARNEVKKWLKKRCEANMRYLGTDKWNSDMEDLIDVIS